MEIVLIRGGKMDHITKIGRIEAIALGLEPDRSEVMSEKPRLADESILTKDFLSQ